MTILNRLFFLASLSIAALNFAAYAEVASAPVCTECGKGAMAVTVVRASGGTAVAVTEGDNYYLSKNLTITVGDTVKWTNNGQENHTTTSENGLWDSGNMKPGQSFSHKFTVVGNYSYKCLYHSEMVGTINVLPVVPKIISPLSATSGVGVSFSYTIDTTGTVELYSAAPLPPGLSLSGNVISGMPTQSGMYMITLGAKNSGGMDSETLTLQIIDTLFEPDQDGDGFPDALETAAGSDPADASSTPYGIAANAALPLNVSRLQIALNFVKPGHDSITLSASVAAPLEAAVANQTIAVDIGGVAFEFTTNSKGVASSANGSVTLKLAPPSTVAITAKLKGAFAAALAGIGLDGSTTLKNAPKTIELNYLFFGSQYSTVRFALYTVTANKSGAVK